MGPIPPPFHGVATFTRDLLADTSDPLIKLVPLDTSDRRDAQNIGRWDPVNLQIGFANLSELACRTMRLRPEIVYIPISQNVPAFIRDALFVMQSRLLDSSVVLHLHGGFFRSLYDQGSASFQFLVRLVLRTAAAVIVESPDFRSIFSGLVPEDRLFVVENGVPDPNAWPLRQAQMNQRRPTLLFMSTLTRSKGIINVIGATALLRQDHPDILLRIAGQWSDESSRAEAISIIEKENLAPHLNFIASVSGNAKAEFLASGDIFTLPSSYPYEGQPLAVLDAMAAGLPVVGTLHGAIGGMIVDGRTGRVIPKDSSPETLAQVFDDLLSNEQLIKDWGAAGRERYLSRYTVEQCHRELFKVFRSIDDL